MKKFILNISLFLFSGIGLVIVFYCMIYFYINSNMVFTNDDMFIWGDSQIYRGIDLDFLNEISKKTIYSSANRGAGIYDFLIFAESIPNGVTAVIGFPKSSFVRPKKHDWNRLGLSFSSLKLLKEHGYTFNEIINIIKHNLLPRKKFNTINEMYAESDTIAINPQEFTSSFNNNYQSVLEYLDDKHLLYLEGISILVKKKCKIIIVDLPYHPYLENFQRDFITYIKINQFRNELLTNLNIEKVDSIYLGKEQSLMHDFTHLTELGAKFTSQSINEYLAISDSVQFISFYQVK